MAKVLCPQCNKAYAFSLPQINNMVRLLDFAEKYISKSCPYIAGGLFVGAGYWSAVTYGAITVMQVLRKPRLFGVLYVEGGNLRRRAGRAIP